VPAPTRTQLCILALLVGDASESEIKAAIGRLQAEADEEQERAEIAALGRNALELQRARAEDRRRARALTALIDTATDLAAHREVDELLTAICRRARLLLGTDVAYITLRDDAATDTYVHTTDGIVSEAFRTMRLPRGTGLGGLVAQTGQPEATADYTGDRRLLHSADVDRRVAGEGLRAIVAAPLKHGSDVVGVLLSGSREVRQFEPSEVALFASLASHAAIALQTARLIQESRDTLADLALAHDQVQRHAQRVERVGEIYEPLAALALRGGDVGELLEAVVGSLPGEIELRGAAGDVLQACRTAGGRHDAQDWLEVPVLAGADELGILRMRRLRFDGIEREILQRCAVLIASILLSSQAQSEAQHRRRSMVLEELLAQQGVASPDLQRRAGRAGIALQTEHVVLVFALDASGERWAWLRATQTAQQRHAVVCTVDGHIVVIEAGSDADAVAGAWSAAMRTADGDPPTIGAASGAPGAEGLRTSHRDAGRALNILLALGREGAWATLAELGIFGQMLGRSGEGDLRSFLQRTLGAIKAYDSNRGTDLLPTLSEFLGESGHLANSARGLGIHINTLYQRLDRLDAVLGEGWRDSDRRLELHLAVRLDALERQIDRRPRA
jgi:sugar diacid utilization regulator/GAF domain-containing protein